MEVVASPTIALDAAQRVVSFTDKAFPGQPFTFTFRRITDEDWRRYFAGFVSQSERVGGERVDTIDWRTAGIDLVDRTLLRVEGYRTRNGDLMELPNWKSRVPFGHKVRAAELLMEVEPSQRPRELVIDPEFEEVSVDAVWNSAEPGKVTKLQGLAHRFTPPTGAHQQRFNRGISEARVVGGRSGRTIYPSKERLLLSMYDELIAAVDGYSVEDQPLESPEQIRRWMDSFHKVVAIQQLFAEPEA